MNKITDTTINKKMESTINKITDNTINKLTESTINNYIHSWNFHHAYPEFLQRSGMQPSLMPTPLGTTGNNQGTP